MWGSSGLFEAGSVNFVTDEKKALYILFCWSNIQGFFIPMIFLTLKPLQRPAVHDHLFIHVHPHLCQSGFNYPASCRSGSNLLTDRIVLHLTPEGSPTGLRLQSQAAWPNHGAALLLSCVKWHLGRGNTSFLDFLCTLMHFSALCIEQTHNRTKANRSFHTEITDV